MMLCRFARARCSIYYDSGGNIFFSESMVGLQITSCILIYFPHRQSIQSVFCSCQRSKDLPIDLPILRICISSRIVQQWSAVDAQFGSCVSELRWMSAGNRFVLSRAYAQCCYFSSPFRLALDLSFRFHSLPLSFVSLSTQSRVG